MSNFDYSHEVPSNFKSRINQLLKQHYSNDDLADAFMHCQIECEDIGNAFYNGIRGNNWNMNAIDITIEGSQRNVTLLRQQKAIMKNAISKAIKSSETGLQIHNIMYLDCDDCAIPESNEIRLNADIKTSESILFDLLKIGERLCSNVLYTGNSRENNLNDFFRDALSLMGYDEVKDQTRHGVSSSGKDAGEVDLLITKEGNENAIFEGLKLSSIDTAYIDEHISKAITNYNALGTATFIVAYVSTDSYEAFWNRYINHLEQYDFLLMIKESIRKLAYPNASTRVARMILSRDDYDFPVYFLTFKLLK